MMDKVTYNPRLAPWYRAVTWTSVSPGSKWSAPPPPTNPGQWYAPDGKRYLGLLGRNRRVQWLHDTRWKSHPLGDYIECGFAPPSKPLPKQKSPMFMLFMAVRRLANKCSSFLLGAAFTQIYTRWAKSMSPPNANKQHKGKDLFAGAWLKDPPPHCLQRHSFSSHSIF